MLQIVKPDERFLSQHHLAPMNLNSPSAHVGGPMAVDPRHATGPWIGSMDAYVGNMTMQPFSVPAYCYYQIPTSPSQAVQNVPIQWQPPPPGYSMQWNEPPMMQMSSPIYDEPKSNSTASMPLIASSAGYTHSHGTTLESSGPVESPTTSPVRRDSSIDHFRGPPRKPQLTGNAVWVGNIPPDANILDLRDHFSQGSPCSSPQSVFLLPRSSCAFLNFKSWESCVDIVHKFHNIPFNGSKLICRLRRPVKSKAKAASEEERGNSSIGKHEDPSRLDSPGAESNSSTSSTSSLIVASGRLASPRSTARVPARYFVVKCLTMTDFDMSVRTGLWATQGTNEEKLDAAYQSADNVYLVFSINKSGAYCGYARMASRIGSESTELHEPVLPSSTPTHFPSIIETPATPYALKGHIIDDQERGSVFWEADDPTPTASKDIDESNGSISSHESATGDMLTSGECKPFKVEWKSTKWVSFSRTHGLRNPWNMDREVKIARDGTELEPNVGSKLAKLFH